MPPRPLLVPALALALALCGCRAAAPAPDRVVIVYPVGPASLDPDAAGEEFAISILGNVYEPLVDLDRALAVRPGLASSWYTRDDHTWVFGLRPGLRLHDGRPLTAQDVARSLERSRTDPASRRQGELTAVERVEAEDARTVLVRTRFPFAAIPNRLATVPISVPAAAANDPPLGTGPYRVRSWTPKADVELEAWNGYRDGPPAVHTLVFRAVGKVEHRVDLLRRGQAHLMVDVPSESLAELRTAGLRTPSQKGLRVLSLVMDTARERSPDVSTPRNPFRDVRVRRALALALDRPALVAEALGGEAEVVDQIVAPSVFGAFEDLKRLPFDPAESRRLMGAAGYAAGFTVTLDYMPGRYPGIDPLVRLLRAQLEAVGIRLTPRPWETHEFFARTARRETAFHLLGWMSTSGDAGATYDFLVHSPGGGYGTQNAGGYANPEADRLIEAAAHQLDPAERLKILHAVAERIQADLPLIPLYRQTDLYAVAPDLEFEPRVDRRIRGTQLRFRDRDR
ncbi:MAG TPA: ABC transporter substrate-binding protein [Vicinamibacteria bacterium]